MDTPTIDTLKNLIVHPPHQYSQVLDYSPIRDFIKFMERDRNGLDCNVLRFVAQMDTTRPIDLDRRFIIFFHLSDDTISIYEPIQRNSG